MSNVISKNLSSEQKKMAQRVCEELKLSNFKITFETNQKQFRFSQDRRTVALPQSLITEERWGDIRFLFRSILSSRNSLDNTGAPNDWGGLGEPV